MRPIDFRYHVVSLVAVFLALGVGILLGGTTSFFNIDTLIKQQDSVIRKLEKNHKALQKQRELDRIRVAESMDYITELERKTIPLLTQGRLKGMALGIIELGEFPGSPEEKGGGVEKVLTDAGATETFKLKLSLESIERMAASRQGSITDDLAAELVLGAAHSTELTQALAADGSLLEGGFQSSVQGLVFVLGEDIDLKLARDILLPLEAAAAARSGIAVNVVSGDYKAYEKLFAEAKTPPPFIQEIETVKSHVELVSILGRHYDNKLRESLKAAAAQQAPPPASHRNR